MGCVGNVVPVRISALSDSWRTDDDGSLYEMGPQWCCCRLTYTIDGNVGAGKYITTGLKGCFCNGRGLSGAGIWGACWRVAEASCECDTAHCYDNVHQESAKGHSTLAT